MGLELGVGFSRIGVENHYRDTSKSISDDANRLHLSFGAAAYGDEGYGYVKTDALDNVTSFFAEDEKTGATLYAPSFEKEKSLTSVNWELVETLYAMRMQGQGWSTPLLLGFQGGLGVVGVGTKTFNEKSKFHESAMLRWGLNSGVMWNNALFYAHFLATYDWYYFMTDATEQSMNGNRWGAEIAFFPHKLESFKNPHLQIFYRKKFGMEYLRPKLPYDKTFSETEMGISILIHVMTFDE